MRSGIEDSKRASAAQRAEKAANSGRQRARGAYAGDVIGVAIAGESYTAHQYIKDL